MARAAASDVHDVAQSGVRDVPESDRELDCPAQRERSLTSMISDGLVSAFARSRGVGAIVLVLLAGGSGVGSSWLLGPGGLRDDSSLRQDIADMRAELAEVRESVTACEAGIDALDDGQVDLVEAVSDTQVKHAKAITMIASKLGVLDSIDVTPPRQRARRIRR